MKNLKILGYFWWIERQTDKQKIKKKEKSLLHDLSFALSFQGKKVYSNQTVTFFTKQVKKNYTQFVRKGHMK